MQVFQVNALSLEIWMDAGWDADMQMNNGRPTFVATSPESSGLPAATTVSAWPEEKLPDILVLAMARSAIRTAAPNFGLPASNAKVIVPTPTSHGVLKGGQADFVGDFKGGSIPERFIAWSERCRRPYMYVALSYRALTQELG